MKYLNRRSAVAGAIAGTVTIGAGIRAAAAGDEAKATKLWTLEGQLGVHPKFVYRYYLMLLDGQKCALYGADHSREPKQLGHLQVPVRVRVRGTLGTEHHSGGTKDNPSPFPEGWWVYMDVHEVEALK